MAEVVFKCKHCNTSIATDDKLCGEVIVCMTCEHDIAVPIPGINPGIELGDFKLLSLLGRGASGEVWLAFQKSMQRKVALKILNPNLAKNATFMRRFEEEAIISAKMNHPNIVTAYYVAKEKGLSYLAITYVDGETIEDKLDNGVIFEEKVALTIIKQIAGALGYAWDELHIVHRDIKPANIIVNAKGVPMLLDLGISKDTQNDMSLTLTGTVVGTPYYMSPEQAVGDKSIDFRSDIYALGTTLYHMLTGRVPYHATTSMAIIMKHLNESFTSPQILNAKISNQCNSLISIMMAKNKPDRHSSWNALIADIELVLNGKYPKTPVPSQKSFSQTSSEVKLPVSPPRQKLQKKFFFAALGAITIIILTTVIIISNKNATQAPLRQKNIHSASENKKPKQPDSQIIQPHTPSSQNLITKETSFQSIVSMLDFTKNSRYEIKANWKNIKGKKFTWHGKFVLFKSRFLNNPEVRIAVPFCKLYKNYNIVLVTPEKEKAATFKSGQNITFSGIPYKYSSKKDGTVVVYMDNVLFRNP